jgi:ABC-2 type transport system permease protein
MKGFAVFARKEALEIVRTWRIWVLPGMVLFFALSGPLMAKWTPQILTAALGSQAGAILRLLSTPTYLDAYGQWTKNLTQIMLIAIIIIYAGLVSSERKSGTATLVVTKPVSRQAFVVAKALVHGVFLSVVVLAGTALTWAVTKVAFVDAPPAALLSGTLTWLVLALFFLALMTLLSVLFDSQAGAAGIGIGAFAVLSIAGLWQPVALNSPAGLISAPSLLTAGKDYPVAIPVIVTIGCTLVLIYAAAEAFRLKEI